MNKISIDRMTLFRSFVDFADGLPNDDMRGRFYTGLARYALDGIEPEFDDSLCRSGFLLIKPVIDKSNHNRRPGNSNAKKRELNANQSRLKRDLNATSSKDIGIGEGIGIGNTNTAPAVADDVFSFTEFWEMYAFKVDRSKCEAKYRKLTRAEREAIRAALPRYVAGTFIDGRYPSRKNPLTWLNGRCWMDEAVPAPHTDQPQQSRAEREMAELEAFTRSQRP